MSDASPPVTPPDPAVKGGGSNPWARRTFALVVCMIAASVVYGPIAGYVYPEYSDFAVPLRDIGLGDVIGKYFGIGQGFYRPTTNYLLPWLLHLDYFEPARQTVVTIAMFALAAWSLTLFAREGSALAYAAGALTVLMAPALYLEAYGAIVDSLYVLLAALFILALHKLYVDPGTGARRWLMVGVTVVAFLLMLTAKEINAMVPFIAVPLLVVMADRCTPRGILQAIKLAAPFMGASLIFVITYVAFGPEGGGVYSTSPNLGRLPATMDLLAWATGFRWEGTEYPGWIPQWGPGYARAPAILLGATALGAILLWRELKPTRIAIYLGTTVAIAAAIASVGGLPHHTFPVVMMYGGAVMAVATVAVRRLRELESPLPTAGLAVGMALLCALLITNGYSRFEDALYRGPHTPYLTASTELFRGSALAPVRKAYDPLLIFEDCLGALHDPLRFYARAPSGSAISTPAFKIEEQLPAIRAAQQAGRPVFVARCTGTGDPWYRVDRLRAG